MSGLPEAEFFISVDTSKMIDGSQKAKQIFAEISNSGLQSMNTIQTQVDNASGKVKTFASNLEAAKGSISSAITPMVGLAASASSLYFSFDQLERASIRVEQAHLRVEKAQDVVNKLIASGQEGTDKYNQALQNLAIQQERYSVSQDQINENMVMMGLSITTLATSTIPGAIKAIQGLTISTEAFGAALDTVAPYLLAATAAFLAWEYAITPLVKSQTGLDLGIQSNISKLIQQHTQVTGTINSFDDLTGTLGSTDGALATITSSFDTLGGSITTATGKVNDLLQAFQEIQTGSVFSSKGVSLLGQNDAFTQAMTQIDQVRSIESDIQKLMDSGLDKQTAINETMDHYLTLLQEEAFQQGESNSQLEKKIELLKQAGVEASKLVDIQKKADTITNSFGIPDSTFNSIVSDLANRLGLTQQQIDDSFNPGGAGNAFNPGLQLAWEQGNRVFGSVWESLNQGLSRGLPFYEGVGYGGISNSGVNTSTAGPMHNDDIHNMLVELVADTHMFGENYGRDKDFLRQAVDNGDALQQSTFEQNSAQWQMFYALRNAGLFTGDPNLSLEENLDNAEKAYDSIFTGLRPDVESALRAANEQTSHYQLYADARSPGIAVTRYTFEVPTQDALNRAIADSRFASEIDFQNKLSEAETKLGLSENDIINSLSNNLTMNDIEAEINFKDRLAAMSTGSA